MGNNYLHGLHGVPRDVDKALSLLSEAAEKGSAEAKSYFGFYHFENGNYEEARRWLEAAAAEGEIMVPLFMLGMMMMKGQAFDKNEETQAEAFRLFTISATLFQGLSNQPNQPAMELSSFFFNCAPVMLHYLRPSVEGGNASVENMECYVLGLLREAAEYYGEKVIFAPRPGHNPVPEALFWYRQCSKTKEPAGNHPLVRLEREIRESCAHCRADLPEGKKSCCVECKAAYYCNRDCQVAHWKAGHKKDCVRKLKKRLKAAGTPFVEP
jgi:TPR repeat protein